MFTILSRVKPFPVTKQSPSKVSMQRDGYKLLRCNTGCIYMLCIKEWLFHNTFRVTWKQRVFLLNKFATPHRRHPREIVHKVMKVYLWSGKIHIFPPWDFTTENGLCTLFQLCVLRLPSLL